MISFSDFYKAINLLTATAIKAPQKGLLPEFYHTLSYEGDLELSERFDAALKLLNHLYKNHEVLYRRISNLQNKPLGAPWTEGDSVAILQTLSELEIER